MESEKIDKNFQKYILDLERNSQTSAEYLQSQENAFKNTKKQVLNQQNKFSIKWFLFGGGLILATTLTLALLNNNFSNLNLFKTENEIESNQTNQTAINPTNLNEDDIAIKNDTLNQNKKEENIIDKDDKLEENPETQQENSNPNSQIFASELDSIISQLDSDVVAIASLDAVWAESLDEFVF